MMQRFCVTFESHEAFIAIGPPGDSILKLVTGNSISTIPDSSSAVATQIVLCPDIAG